MYCEFNDFETTIVLPDAQDSGNAQRSTVDGADLLKYCSGFAKKNWKRVARTDVTTCSPSQLLLLFHMKRWGIEKEPGWCGCCGVAIARWHFACRNLTWRRIDDFDNNEFTVVDPATHHIPRNVFAGFAWGYAAQYATSNAERRASWPGPST